MVTRRARFRDRTDAGDALAAAIRDRGVEADVVLAIPRGGLPVGRAVADALDRPLDVVVAAKVGAPWSDEVAIGAVGSDGTAWLDETAIDRHGIDRRYVQERLDAVATAASEKEERYRGSERPQTLSGQSVLLVDDGAATGATLSVAIRVARARDASRVVVGLPVAPPRTADRLRTECAELICLHEPSNFGSVGQYYADFTQVSDDEATRYLDR